MRGIRGFSDFLTLKERGLYYPSRDGVELNFLPVGIFLVFRHPFGVVSKMIAEKMNSGSDELTCSELLGISSSLIAIAYTNRKMLRDLIFLVCLILAKVVLRLTNCS